MSVKDIITTIPKTAEARGIPLEGYDFKNRYYKKIPLKRAEDLSNKQYNFLTPLFRVETEQSLKNKKTYWLCRCKCGNLTVRHTYDILNKAKSCGCDNLQQARERKISDLIGKRFNHLLVLEETKERKYGDIIWKCLCDCGKITYVMTRHLKTGDVSSCGCFKTDSASKSQMKDRTNIRYGKLVAKRPIKRIDGVGWTWECLCDCGSHVTVRGCLLENGHTQSCGCLKSKGEFKISQLLIENNIPFTKQKTFKNCYLKNKCAKMKYDFYINNSFLLEYDGEQHFISSDFFGGEEGLKETQERDLFKNEWAKNNNIPLKRVPYWDLYNLTIEDILNDKYLIT